MSDKAREFAEIPQQFVREGTLVGREGKLSELQLTAVCQQVYQAHERRCLRSAQLVQGRVEADCVEYIQLCRAVAVGFAVMGFIGYLVKLIHIPM